MESQILCKVFATDVEEKLKENDSDEKKIAKKFKIIEEIAKNLHMGDKFKVKAASVLYPLCYKNIKELYMAQKSSKEFSKLFDKEYSDEDKGLIWQVYDNYNKVFAEKDKEHLLLDKTIDTLPRVLEKAKDSKGVLDVFYNKYHQEEVDFSKNDIINKFYSVDLGVCVSMMGSIKTPMFVKRNTKTPLDEVRRLEAMENALDELDGSKFMIFALHFDKYIEKLTKVTQAFVKSCKENVLPVVKGGKNKYLSSVGNMFGSDFVDYGSSGFSFKCLTSKFTPYNITRLCRIAEQIPSIDDNRFENIRTDAIYVDEVYPELRMYVHNQGKYVHRLLKRMDAYYQAKINGDEEILPEKIELIKKAVDDINTTDKGYNFKAEKYLDIKNYENSVVTRGKTEKVSDIIHRLAVNTTPKTMENPKTNDPELNAYFEKISRYEEFPFNAHIVFGEYLEKLNNSLIKSIDDEKYGISHNLINTILWTERKAFNILENMDAGYQLGAYKEDWFKNIVKFYELTNSASVKKFDEKEFNQFFDSIENQNMEGAYKALTERVVKNIDNLSKKQRQGGKKYLNYLDTLNLSEEESKYIKEKMGYITDEKVSRNFSYYSLGKALVGMIRPRECKYKAVKDYMESRFNKLVDMAKLFGKQTEKETKNLPNNTMTKLDKTNTR